MKNEDKYFMKIAIQEAKKASDAVFPNPKVGCIITKNGKIISKGFHKKFGDRHAEKMAIDNLNLEINQATMYVTLEPCAHTGKTKPCIDLISPKIFKKIVISNNDPNPLSKNGVEILKKKNIEVKTGVCKKKSKKINKRFFTFHEKKRPYVIIKCAMTLDGFIAEKNGKSKWITNEKSRKSVHKLRSICDAILIGNKTANSDNPSLTSHKQGKNPKIVLIDPSNNASKNLKLFDRDPIIFNNEALEKNSINNVSIILEKLYKKQIQSLLVEGGGYTITSFIDSKLFDELHLYYAPKLIGEGISSYKSIRSINNSNDLKLKKIDKFGNDFRVIYKRKN